MPKIIPDIREKILSSARNQLMTGGYAGLSLRRVADDCEIALGTTYHYFSSKQELAVAVMAEDWSKEVNYLKDINPNETGEETCIVQLFRSIKNFTALYDGILLNHRSYSDTVEAMSLRHANLVNEISASLDFLLHLYRYAETESFTKLMAECLYGAADGDTSEDDLKELVRIYLYARKHR